MMKKIIDVGEQIEWLKKPDNITAYSHTFKKEDEAAKEDGSRKIIKSGTIYPKNDKTAIGIVLNDVDVTDGDREGSLVVHADVVEKKLPDTIDAEAKYVLIQGGIHFYTYKDAETALVTPSEPAGE